MRPNTPRHARNTPEEMPEESDDEGAFPMDLDEGLVHAMIADDPEYDRVVEPQD